MQSETTLEYPSKDTQQEIEEKLSIIRGAYLVFNHIKNLDKIINDEYNCNTCVCS